MRQGFRDISSGWMLYSGTEDLDERIERLAEWTKENGPLEPDEHATVRFMIESQIARKMFPRDDPAFDSNDEDDSEGG